MEKQTFKNHEEPSDSSEVKNQKSAPLIVESRCDYRSGRRIKCVKSQDGHEEIYVLID